MPTHILFVYPRYNATFWSFRYALKFISRKAAFPPLGLLTVASLMPPDWKYKLVDMNVHSLKIRDLLWADYVFISAMEIQEESARSLIQICKVLGKKIVAGGPLFSARYLDFAEVDHILVGEAELVLPLFLNDLKEGNPVSLYTTRDEWADITKTPLPRWDLVNTNEYATMNIQYSRGCPYDCEFCDITLLNGRKVRTKTTEQFISELESLYRFGWRGSVFVVDDNFIGNKKKLKDDILPAMINWNSSKKYPFTFNTQSSIELADDDTLLGLMAQAGFYKVFVGIETPEEKSLVECGKFHNQKHDMLACIKKIQDHGILVEAGFIVGFDNDSASIFDTQIKFIQESDILTAMVGLLHVLPKTKLHQRLVREKRMLAIPSGDNMDFSLNFIPRMDSGKLVEGYHRILETIYAPKHYYKRLRNFLKHFKPRVNAYYRPSVQSMMALVKTMFILGLVSRTRLDYWKMFFWTIFHRPKLFSLAITYAIYGYHFRKIVSNNRMN